jgi:PncC family amidohydrolase
VVSYATEVKRDVLGVSAEEVITAECAEQMAAGARRVLSTDWALSTTGVAGPDEQEGHPVGTVFVGLAGPDGVETEQLALEGDRYEIRRATCASAVELLLSRISRG